MTTVYFYDGAVEIPEHHCGRYWELYIKYQNSPDFSAALNAHLEVCTTCQAWIETVSNAGGELPYLTDEP